jgi:RHS repeat-associated protein
MAVRYTTVEGQVLCENRGGVKTLFMPDTLGNVIETRNMDTGAQTSSTTYWPYGEVRTQTGTNPSPFGFCGVWGYYTQAGQPTYVRARYYRPNLGRWQTVDPLWPWEQSFTYAKADPLAQVDPSGFQHCTAYGCSCGLHTNFEVSALPTLGDIIRTIGGCPQKARSQADNSLRSESERKFPGMDQRGDTARNAVNHCASACWARIKCGRLQADLWLNLVYEAPDRRRFKTGDMVNNYKGFQCADQIESLVDSMIDAASSFMPFPMPIAVSPLDCFACCYQKFKNKDLVFH